MPFLYETVKPTYVVYCGHPVDEQAAKLIAKRKGFPVLLTSNVKDPSVYDPVYDENNLILVAGWMANPYTAHYFPWLAEGYDPETETLAPGPGVSKDGHRVITSIIRPNGTSVTVIAGVHAEDTLQSAYEYTKTNVLALVGTLAAEVAAAIAIAKV